MSRTIKYCTEFSVAILDEPIATVELVRSARVVGHQDSHGVVSLVARAELEQLRADRERLDFLLDWLGLHDDLEGSRIRDWKNNADARVAIDEARKRRTARSGQRAPND